MQRVAVIGGGLVGCLLAIFLARRGNKVQVFERQPDPRQGRTPGVRRPSINLTLCERGLRALEAVGIRQRALDLAVPARGRRIHDLNGAVTYQPYGNHGEAIHSISRRDLNELLLDCAAEEPNVELYFSRKCVQLDLDSASASLEDATGSSVSQLEADAIFGADGAYSAVRLQLQKTDLFNYSQQYWTQGYKEFTMPAPGSGSWPLQEDALHIWPRGGYMLIAFANHDRSFTCALHLPHHGPDSHEELSSEERLMEFMNRSFPDAIELIPELAQQFFAKPANSMLTVRCNPWRHTNKVALIGDAAHAILPSYGQGANAGFEDCLILDGCLQSHGADWHSAFSEYEALRRPNTDAMATLCEEHFAELRDKVGDAEFLRAKALELELSERYPELYQPLYTMISFSQRPYAEALSIERRQRHALDELLRLDDVGQKLDSPNVRAVLERALARAE